MNFAIQRAKKRYMLKYDIYVCVWGGGYGWVGADWFSSIAISLNASPGFLERAFFLPSIRLVCLKPRSLGMSICISVIAKVEK